MLKLTDLVQELRRGHNLLLDDHIRTLVLNLINVHHIDGHRNLIDDSVYIILNLLNFINFDKGLFRYFIQTLLLVGGAEPCLLNVFEHLADRINLGDYGLVKHFAFFEQFMEGFGFRLLSFHLLDSDCYRLEILFYFFKKALNVILDHVKNLRLDDSLEYSLVHWGEVIQRVLNQSNVGHEPRSVVKNLCSFFGQLHFNICDLFEVSIEDCFEIKLIMLSSLSRGEGSLSRVRSLNQLNGSPDFFHALPCGSKLPLERVFFFGTLDRTNGSHE